MRFYKYQGLGNDFVLIDLRLGEVDLTPARVRALCDRHFGVGADGVLALMTGERWDKMVVHNADGSQAEMCGNGLRCVARYLMTRGGHSSPLVIETGAGPLEVQAQGDLIQTELGHVRAERALCVEGLSGHFVDLGNPHFVLTPEAIPPERLLTLGPALQHHPAFPAGVNLSLPSGLTERGYQLHVWERGAGPTLACGTAAGASFVALNRMGLRSASPAQVELPGGTLLISGQGETLLACGPAAEVFQGDLQA